jgi:hypothetical protein
MLNAFTPFSECLRLSTRANGRRDSIGGVYRGVGECVDALMHARPYKGAWSHKEAVAEIKRLSGAHFDPKLVALFVPMVNQLRKQFLGDAFDENLSRAGNESSFLQARDRIQEMLRETEALLS